MTSAETVAQMASALAFIAERHRPAAFVNGTDQMYTCQACSLLAGIPIVWPCDDRAAVGALFPDPSNRLLPDRPGPDAPAAGPGHLPGSPRIPSPG